jgi:hypothetical protein
MITVMNWCTTRKPVVISLTSGGQQERAFANFFDMEFHSTEYDDGAIEARRRQQDVGGWTIASPRTFNALLNPPVLYNL